MSQERPQSNTKAERLGEETHMPPPTLDVGGPISFPLSGEANPPAPTLNRYWKLFFFNDPEFSPLTVNPEPLVVTAEALASPTKFKHWQIVEPLQPAPRSTPQQMQPELPLTWEDQPMPQPDLDGKQHFSAEVRLGTPSTTDGRSMSPPRGSTPTTLELDTFSSDSADLLRAQLRQVNQRLDKVQKEFVKSKEELGESSKDGSLFVPEI
ncbi:hypothetical protein BHM03_00014207 [Ensete ventricosum]|nr:hypothetical protein BHM03_00014207 [Ensete ventricosum]